MTKDDQSALLMLIIIMVCVCLGFDVIASGGKAWLAFYHQVILKDEVAGQVNTR